MKVSDVCFEGKFLVFFFFSFFLFCRVYVVFEVVEVEVESP